MTKGKFETFIGKGKQRFWHLKSANGKVIAQGEGFTQMKSVLKSIRAVKRCAATANVVHLDQKISLTKTR